MPRTFIDRLVELNDPVLEPLLRSSGDDPDREIERLVLGEARPIVATIINGLRRTASLSAADAEDIVSNIRLRLVIKLRHLRLSEGEAILDFARYVNTLASNAVSDHLRATFPMRTRLKNRLRYGLRHDPRLASWNVGGHVVCGLREWTDFADWVTEIAFDDAPDAGRPPERGKTAESLVALFQHVGRPVSFEAVVEFIGKSWHLVDLPSVSLEFLPPPQSPSTTQFEVRDSLRVLWTEIRALRPLQRKALLLNLRSADTANVLALFVVTGIVSYEELAAALEIEEAVLLQLWRDLPLDDLQIAAMMGIQRQQVINLRKSARERLSRRMRARS